MKLARYQPRSILDGIFLFVHSWMRSSFFWEWPKRREMRKKSQSPGYEFNLPLPSLGSIIIILLYVHVHRFTILQRKLQLQMIRIDSQQNIHFFFTKILSLNSSKCIVCIWNDLYLCFGAYNLSWQSRTGWLIIWRVGDHRSQKWMWMEFCTSANLLFCS